MKWAVIGLGFVSSRHIQAIRDIGDKVLMTCDINKNKNPDYSDWKYMMDNKWFKEVDCVSIATPDHLHYPITIGALKKGKRVLCEKPLTFTSQECLTLPNDGSVGTILQLRNHPEIIKLKESNVRENGFVEVRVCREKRYWDSWHGDKNKCGGILHNIGVHYLDLFLYLLGDDYSVVESHYSPKRAWGKIDFNGVKEDYYFEIMDTQEEQDRILKIGDREISLSRENNLAFEGWHTEVFKNFINNKVILPDEASKSLVLIEKLKNNHNYNV